MRTIVAALICTILVSSGLSAEKLAKPGAPEREQALQKIRAIYKEDYEKAFSPIDRSIFAQKLLANARDADNLKPPSERYTLVAEAINVARQGPDIHTVIEAIDELAKNYQIDALNMKIDTVMRIAKGVPKKRPVDYWHDLLRTVEALIQEATKAEEFALGAELVEALQEAADRLPDRDYRSKVRELNNRLGEAEERFQEFQEAQTIVHNGGPAGAANLTVGKYLCFVRGDWETGPPILALGGNAELKALADKEQEPPANAQAQNQLGNGWWRRGQHEDNEADSIAMKQRACCWYEEALQQGLAGLDKAVAQQRVHEMEPPLNALKFNGKEYVSTNFRYKGGPLTLEMWVQPSAIGGTQNAAGNCNAAGFYLGHRTLGGRTPKWEFGYHDTTGYKHATSNLPPRPELLVHLAGVYDGTRVRFYINGRLCAETRTRPRSHQPSTLGLIIGADPRGGGACERHFRGLIHSVHIAATVLYEREFIPPLRPLKRHPSSWLLLQFDEGTGTFARDSSGHNNHGEIVGATWARIE